MEKIQVSLALIKTILPNIAKDPMFHLVKPEHIRIEDSRHGEYTLIVGVWQKNFDTFLRLMDEYFAMGWEIRTIYAKFGAGVEIRRLGSTQVKSFLVENYNNFLLAAHIAAGEYMLQNTDEASNV